MRQATQNSVQDDSELQQIDHVIRLFQKARKAQSKQNIKLTLGLRNGEEFFVYSVYPSKRAPKKRNRKQKAYRGLFFSVFTSCLIDAISTGRRAKKVKGQAWPRGTRNGKGQPPMPRGAGLIGVDRGKIILGHVEQEMKKNNPPCQGGQG